MATLRNQLLLILALAFGALLAAKVFSDLSRTRPRVEDETRARARVALLQGATLLQNAYREGQWDGVRGPLGLLGAAHGVRRASLVRPEGGLLASSDGGSAGRSTAEELARTLAAMGSAGGMTVHGDVLRAAVPVALEPGAPDPQWFGPPSPPVGPALLLLDYDLAVPLAAALTATWIETGVAAVVGLAILLVVALLAGAGLVRPARQLVDAIERFDGGDRSARSDVRGSGEVARIARAFDGMADRFQAEEEDLLDAHVGLDNVLKALPIGVLVVRRDDGRPHYVNPRWRELFGIPMDASRDILSILSTVRCERPDCSPFPLEQLPIPAVLRTGRPAEVRDLRVRHDDRVVALCSSAVPLSLARAEDFDAVLAIAYQPDAALAAVLASGTPRPEASQGGEEGRGIVDEVAAAIERCAVTEPDSDRETVLLAEADSATRLRAVNALVGAGYRVLMAGDGGETLATFQSEAPLIRAVILDLGLDGPSGTPLLDDLMALDPSMKVLAVSGYRPDLPELAASGKITAFLTRPYSEERLIAAVREALCEVLVPLR